MQFSAEQLGAFAALMMTILGASWRLSSALTSVRVSLEHLTERVARLEPPAVHVRKKAVSRP